MAWSRVLEKLGREAVVRWENTKLGRLGLLLSLLRSAFWQVICRGVAVGGGSTALPFLGVELHVDSEERDATRHWASNDQRAPPGRARCRRVVA